MRRTLTTIPWVSLLCAGALLMGAVASSYDDDSSTTTTESTTTEAAVDGPTTLAQGEDIKLDGSPGIGTQTLNIDAVEENGEVTGEFQHGEVVVRVDCADTDTDGIVILGGEVTTGAPGFIEVGDRQGLSIKEGDPDSVSLHGPDAGAESCTEYLESIVTDDPTGRPGTPSAPPTSGFVPVADGYDIETG